MSVDGGVEQERALPPVPGSIWVVAWASLAGQVLLLVRHGVRDDDAVSITVSVALGAVIVGYVSAGVVRARTVRVVVARVVLVLGLIGAMMSLVSADDGGGAALAVLALASTALALVGLWTFRRTEWYAWQRTRPSVRGAEPIHWLVVIGMLVGLLGGLASHGDDGLHTRVDITYG